MASEKGNFYENTTKTFFFFFFFNTVKMVSILIFRAHCRACFVILFQTLVLIS